MVNENQPLPFDILLTTPKGLSLFKPYGRALGPKGLMPNEKRGTIVEDFSSYTKKEEIGIELKLDGEGKTSNGAALRVVVGKVPSIPEYY
jgi:large subunit ribosomal protein L1